MWVVKILGKTFVDSYICVGGNNVFAQNFKMQIYFGVAWNEMFGKS